MLQILETIVCFCTTIMCHIGCCLVADSVGVDGSRVFDCGWGGGGGLTINKALTNQVCIMG